MHDANLCCVKNHLWNSVGLLFHETGKLISEQKEITGGSTLTSKMLRGCRQAYCAAKQITNAKAYAFSDSVLCVVKWEMSLLRPGRAKLNGTRKTITSRI